MDAENLSLFPGDSETVVAQIDIPVGLGAGGRRIAVQVRELTPPRAVSVTEIDLAVPPHAALAVLLEPMMVLGGRHAGFGVTLTNTGNTTTTVYPSGTDDEGKIQFRFQPAAVTLAPGDHAIADLRTTAPRRWFGSPVVRPFGLHALPAPADPTRPTVKDADPLAQGTFLQKPRLGRGALSLIGLVLAVSVFAVVITVALSKLVGASAADRDLALQVAAARDQSAEAGGTARLGGTVVLLTTGGPAGAVTVELFVAGSGTATPIASTATNDNGVWALPGLSAGKYQVRFRSAGFSELWYPAALTATDAGTVELTSGQQKTDLAVVLGGLPAEIAGVVVGEDVAGAIISVELPADQLPSDEGALPAGTSGTAPGALVTKIPVGSDGLFTVSGVASPAVYDLVVSKPGYATDTQRIDLSGGETRTGISLRLRTGDGVIAGTVTGPDGPLGQAVITATTGSVTTRTVSLTDQRVGEFTLRGLVTPGTYTVTVALDGYTTQSSSLTLTAGQTLAGVQLALARASGGISGTVRTLLDNQTAPGVTVTVSAGQQVISTVTQSGANSGNWTVTGLPVPNTYTLTFSRPDLQAQTLAVALDGAGNPSTGGPVTVSLQSAYAIVTGLVTQQEAAGPVGVGEAAVTLASANDTYLTTTASTPTGDLGTFRLDRVNPGTYTLSVSRKGTRPSSQIVTLAAGDRTATITRLIQPASLTGTVTDLGQNAPAVGVTVNLYRTSEYPSAVYKTTTTDQLGHYRFDDLDAPEAYVVEVSTASGGPLTAKTITVSGSEAATADLGFGTPPTTVGG